MRGAMFASLILGALPLVVYPAVVIASVMGLAGHRTGDQAFWQMALVNAFYVGSVAYPIVYVAGAIASISARKRQQPRAALALSLAPLGYLSVLAAVLGLAFQP
jgi:hypothetical protein